jgi:hypothetical protein
VETLVEDDLRDAAQEDGGPMVMMMSVTADAPRAGSIAKRCSASPTATAARMASTAAIGSGMPAATAKTVTIPPSMTNSPCAKFTTSDAL